MWPDIYARTPETEFIVDFHREGFKKLLDHWDDDPGRGWRGRMTANW